MKNKIFLLAFMLIYSIIQGQNVSTVSIDSCLLWAAENYPLHKANVRYMMLYELKNEQLKKNYYPKFDLNGQASYQSEVAKIPIDFSDVTVDVGIPGISPKINFPTIEDPPHENLKVTLDISQLIYDGGVTKSQRGVEETELSINEKSVETEIYKVKEIVADVCFGILQLKESIKILELTKKDIQNQLDRMDAVIAQGMMLQTDKDLLKAEMLSIESKIIEAQENLKSSFKIISNLTGRTITEKTEIVFPAQTPVAQFIIERPDYYMLGLYQQRIDKTKLVLNSKNMPKVAGFGQAGYGKPGMNVFSNEFNPWYMVGVTVKWKLWDWNTNKTDLKMLDMQREIIELQKESLVENLKTANEKNQADIDKYTKMLDNDRELIGLRTKIKETASSQHLNGTLTVADYLNKVNEEMRSKLQLKAHEILLEKAKYDKLRIVGKL